MSARKPPVAVLGAGKLGAAVAQLLAGNGHHVRVWARNAAQVQAIVSTATQVEESGTLEEACRGAPVVIFAVPAAALAATATRAGAVVGADTVFLHAARGVGAGFALPHALLRAAGPVSRIGALGGPLYIDELQSGRPVVSLVASRFFEVHAVVADLVRGSRVSLHKTHDVVGVEVAGAMAYVGQLAVGAAHALGMSATDQGLLLTRALGEATKIGVHLGANPATFGGLAGLGELIPRPVTQLRLHREHGERAARGAHADASALEGPHTVRMARALGAAAHLELPLVVATDAILHHGANARAALDRVLALDLRVGQDG